MKFPESQEIHCQLSDAILSITLARPEKKNALTQAMYSCLAETLRLANDDQQVRVIVLQGHEQCFCAGNDINDFLQQDEFTENSPALKFIEQLMLAKKPVVAAVRGPAIGIGTTLLLHCDMVFCHQQAIFQLPFVQLGLTAEAASSFLLPQLIGHRRAADMLMAGNAIDAETALSWGLVNKVDNNPEQCAAETAQQLAKLPPKTLQQNKALMKAAFEPSAREANRREVVAFTEALQSEEAKQAFKRFLS